MTNLTVTIDRELLRRARMRALEEGTSVNAVVRAHLERYAAGGAQAAVAELLRLSDEALSSGISAGPRWTREELYDDMFRRSRDPLPEPSRPSSTPT